MVISKCRKIFIIPFHFLHWNRGKLNIGYFVRIIFKLILFLLGSLPCFIAPISWIKVREKTISKGDDNFKSPKMGVECSSCTPTRPVFMPHLLKTSDFRLFSVCFVFTVEKKVLLVLEFKIREI